MRILVILALPLLAACGRYNNDDYCPRPVTNNPHVFKDSGPSLIPSGQY